MKTILCLSLSLWLLACTDMGELTVYNYTVKNESGVNLKIIGYRKYGTPHIIHIVNGATVSQRYKDGLPPRGYHFSFFFGSSDGRDYADSIRVIYGNVKYKNFNYKNLNDERNPLGPFHNSGKAEETFTFTVEDYENAEDCTGNCE